MSVGQTIILSSPSAIQRAQQLLTKAPRGAVVNIAPPRRTNSQNDLMWALLGEISRAKPGGRVATPDVWKALFLHSLDHAQRFEEALDGRGMVPVGFRSSRLTKEQFSDLIETIREYGARHNVTFGEE